MYRIELLIIDRA